MPLPPPSLFNTLPWASIQPHVDALLAAELTPATIAAWLKDWSDLRELIQERGTLVSIANVQDTTDLAAEAAYKAYLNDIRPPAQQANNDLTQKLLASGLSVPGLEIPLRSLRTDAEIFREANLPLQTAEQQNGISFNKIAGAQTIEWDGIEHTITGISPQYEASPRDTRRAIFERIDAREEQDRPPINTLWREALGIRAQIAANAGFPGDYRAYAWRARHRHDYTPPTASPSTTPSSRPPSPPPGASTPNTRKSSGWKNSAPGIWTSTN